VSEDRRDRGRRARRLRGFGGVSGSEGSGVDVHSDTGGESMLGSELLQPMKERRSTREAHRPPSLRFSRNDSGLLLFGRAAQQPASDPL